MLLKKLLEKLGDPDKFLIPCDFPRMDDSLITGDEHLSTFSAEEIIPIPRESEDTSRSDSKNVLSSCDDYLFYPEITYSSSEASSDFHSDASFDSSSRYSLPDHSSPDLPSTSAGLSHKRRRSPMASVLALPPVSRALSPVRADLIPSPKRIRSPETATDLEGCSEDSFEPYIPREVDLGVDIEDESSEQSRSRGTDIEVDDDVERSDRMDIDPVEAVIEACF
ncbi:hypothetical protein Tco_0860854 [Tanacetum coccineum]|uniref:Uncharacterized protein n=1 Tax=Tanacetum coccineum TaxID=301880 RepID=A0ABQ5BJ90_9ASTR